MNHNRDIVGKVWRLCSILRKDGITYQQYLSELTYLIFLKMVSELGRGYKLPAGTSWGEIAAVDGSERVIFYRRALKKLGTGGGKAISAIFNEATTAFRDGGNLERVMDRINELEWMDVDRDAFGEIYEGILQKNAEETKRGAGQYFTPRPLVEAIVDLMPPRSGEVLQDPAAGTGGFLVEAARHARDHNIPIQISGMENVPDTHRLLLMNLLLHDIPADQIHLGDTLSPDHLRLPAPTLILTNPPFGPAGGRADRDDLAITFESSSFAPPFVEHCIRALPPGGRAAIVVPDSLLYEGGRVQALRRLILAECKLEVVLKLPSGIFYAAGVKTNVLFLERGSPTSSVWFYDLRADMPTFGKNTPFHGLHLDDFKSFYRSRGGMPDNEVSEDPRARRVSREEIAARDDDLAISVFSSSSARDENLVDPEDMIAAAAEYVGSALAELRLLSADIEAEKMLREPGQ